VNCTPTAQAFVQHRLIDEYWFKVHPVAIGAGRPVFPDLKDRMNLHLTHSQAHASGLVTLRYQPDWSPAALSAIPLAPATRLGPPHTSTTYRSVRPFSPRLKEI
jgi:hypothetical protein